MLSYISKYFEADFKIYEEKELVSLSTKCDEADKI